MINLNGKKAVAVIGSRTCTDKDLVFRVLDKNKDKIGLIVSGGCRGPDSFGTEWATERGIPFLVFPAKWKTDDGKFDRSAGMRRNRHIIQASEVVIAFFDGCSKGTSNSLEIAKQLNKPVSIIPFTPAKTEEPSESEPTTEDVL